MLWFSGTTKQSVVLNSQAFVDATKYIPARVWGHLRFKDRCPPCATNILVITRRGRRVAQAALELCGSSERLGLMTLMSSMSLNAERVACRTLTPWKSRQHKRRFQRSYRQARGKRLPAAFLYSPSTRRRCSSRISSAMLVRDNRMSSANGAFGRHDRQDSAGIRLVTAASR
jgi:hypothetical protein